MRKWHVGIPAKSPARPAPTHVEPSDGFSPPPTPTLKFPNRGPRHQKQRQVTLTLPCVNFQQKTGKIIDVYCSMHQVWG